MSTEEEKFQEEVGRVAAIVEKAVQGEPQRVAVVALCLILGEQAPTDDALATIHEVIDRRYEQMEPFRKKAQAQEPK